MREISRWNLSQARTWSSRVKMDFAAFNDTQITVLIARNNTAANGFI